MSIAAIEKIHAKTGRGSEMEILTDEVVKQKFDELVTADSWRASVDVMKELTAPVLEDVAQVETLLDTPLDNMPAGEKAELIDLQQEKIDALHQKLDGMTEVFMERPYAAFVSETLNLFELNNGRVTAQADPENGNVTAEFVTRDAERRNADMHFVQTRREDGSWEIRVTMPLRGATPEESEPFTIVATSERDLHVEQSVYRNYAFDTVEFREDDHRRNWDDRLRRYFKDTIVATGLAYERTPDQQAAADTQARHMLRTAPPQNPVEYGVTYRQ